MRRRGFLKNIGSMAAGNFLLNGLPLRRMDPALMLRPFQCDQINDRILVLIQLHGGNDGLNTLIPLDQYDRYKNLRPIIGIQDSGNRKFLTLDKHLLDNQQIGLHPDMTGIKSLYDEGYVSIVQNVAYANTNGSHFRGADIWLSGKDGAQKGQNLNSGWFGRYLDHWYPQYPDAYPSTLMPDPPGLEFGSHIVSLGFHRKEGIPMGLTMSNDPIRFLEDLEGLGGLLPQDIPQSEYGDEIRFIKEVEKSTNIYANRLSKVFQQGRNAAGIIYPETYHTPAENFYENWLSGQLKTVARLISGGCTTKVYLVRLGGFDTHANQAIAGKPSFGGHGALLYHLSEAVSAFQQDLQQQGLADRVISVTFSEFGRQIAENGDWGTDHGTTAPMMIIGKGVKPGVIGRNPNLQQLRNNRLIGFEHDYRQIFATILQDWLGANNGTLNEVEFLEFANQKLDLINNNFLDDQGQTINFVADTSCDTTPEAEPPAPNPTSIDNMIHKDDIRIFPNPAREYLFIEWAHENLLLETFSIFDLSGKLVMQEQIATTGPLKIELAGIPSGVYSLKITAMLEGKQVEGSRKMIKY